MSNFDLVIRSGEIVTAAGKQGRGDIAIKDGVIVQIGGAMGAENEVDASGKLVLPGGFDAHVHLSMPPEYDKMEPRWVDDFTSGSEAALAGGITTLGNMTTPSRGETPMQALAREAEIASKQTIVDLILHPVFTNAKAETIAEIPDLMKSGCNSIKIFTVFQDFDSQVLGYLDAVRLAGENGMISVIHCEDDVLIQDATNRLVAQNKTSIRHYPESRPVISEVVATQRAIALAEVTGAPMYVVHLSSKRALEVCMDAQARGLPVYVETRPLYLFFTSERFNDPDGAKFLGQPPLREQEDIEAIWTGIQNGSVHTVCTDHAPWMLEAKLDPAHTITSLRPGVADLQFMLPVLFSEGVRKGKISLDRFVQVTSSNAAKLFGLFPRKGTIAVGSDADLIILDPNLSLKVNSTMYKSKSDYSVFEGWQVTGWPVMTIRRGQVVFQDGDILGQPGSGLLLPRKQTGTP